MPVPVIHVRNAYSKIDCDRNTIIYLDQHLSVEVPGAFFAKQYRPNWDGKWHPLNIVHQSFPTGLVERVKKIIPVCEVIDERDRPAVIPFRKNILLDLEELSDHQSEAVQTIFKKVNGIAALSVGSGKTEVGIAAACHVHGLCVWLTHKRDLFHQTAERIKWRTGETAVMIGDGVWEEPTEDTKFIIVMPQTVLKNLPEFFKQVQDAKVLVVDEAHTAAAADSWYKVAMGIPAYFRVGLTGTPEIGDPVRERRLEAATGEILIRRRSSEMAKLGWVVPAEVHYHKVVNQPLFRVDWQTARRVLIEENPERNAMVVSLALDAAHNGQRCLIICDTIRHAMIIAEVIKGENVRSRMLSGHNHSSDRMAAKKDLRSGALEIMISTPIWDMGVDIPEIEVLIIAAGGKSASRFIQRCGRALRMSPGKKVALIHDFFDTGNGYMTRHSVSRIEACRKEGFEVKGYLPVKQVARGQG